MVSRHVRAGAVLAALSLAGSAGSAKAALVFSQLYADGGYSATSTYAYDYVVLFNTGPSPVSLGGDLLEYAGYKGTLPAAPTYDTVPLNAFTLQSGQSFLIELASNGTGGVPAGGAALPVTPDQVSNSYTASFAPNFAGAKLQVVTATGSQLAYFGYGDDVAEGASPAGSGGVAASFASGAAYGSTTGFTGTDVLFRTLFTSVDSNDFTVTSAVTAPVNSASPVPEPATLGLAAVAGVGLLARRRRS